MTPEKPRVVPHPRPRILIVDDEARVRDMLADFLRNEGFAVQTAGNGDAALAAIERQRPTLLLLDMRMPVMDGRTLVDVLRSRGMDLPVVVMTGAADARQHAEELGAVAYVAKPIALPLLLARINAVAA